MAERGKIWELFGRSVKWEDVVRHAPKIVEAARVLYETNRQRQPRSADPAGSRPGPDPTSGLKAGLDDLELQVRRLQENETSRPPSSATSRSNSTPSRGASTPSPPACRSYSGSAAARWL